MIERSRERRKRAGVPEPSEDEAMRIAVAEQHAHHGEAERLLSELHNVLMRRRFRRHMTESEVENLVEDLREKGISVEEGEIGRMVPGDPKDDFLVALARVSGAGYLISSDPHLTAASLEVATVTVLTPRRFSEMLEERDL